MARKKTPDLDQSLQKLEALVAKLESGDLPLDESLKIFEQGVTLTRQCQEALRDAEQRVEILVKEAEAEQLLPFDAGEDV